jgi:hypothetical protein
MTLFQSRGVFFCVPESLTARLHAFWPVSLSLAVSLEKRTTAETGAPRIAVVPDFRPSTTEQGDAVYITSAWVS